MRQQQVGHAGIGAPEPFADRGVVPAMPTRPRLSVAARHAAHGGQGRRRAARRARAVAVRAEMGRVSLPGLQARRGVELRAKSGKPLGRYFPEIVAMLQQLPMQRFVVDGELVIAIDGALSFDALQMRLHPAESRIRKLAAETPAHLMLFDMLVDAGRRESAGRRRWPSGAQRSRRSCASASRDGPASSRRHARAQPKRKRWLARCRARRAPTASSPSGWTDPIGRASAPCSR